MSDYFSINIGERQIRIADLIDKKTQISANALGMAEADFYYYSVDTEKNIEAEAEIINNLVKSLGILKKKAQVVIPDAYSFSQLSIFPKLNEKELQSAIRYQADQLIPLPIDEVSLDIEVLRENPETKELTVFIVASPLKVVKQIEKTIEMAGLEPYGLESEFSSIRRFIFDKGKIFLPEQTVFLLINFGFTNTSIYLFDTKNFVVLNRNVKIGLDLLIKDIKVNLNIDDKKAREILQTIGFDKNGSVDAEAYIGPIIKELTDEINHFLLIAKEQYSLAVDKVYIFNDDSMVMSLDKAIQGAVSLPVSPFPIAAFLKQNPTTNSFGPAISGFFGAMTGCLGE